MSTGQESIDGSDPGARALIRLRNLSDRDQTGRIAAAAALAALGIAMPLTATPLTGDPGATVGAVVAALLCLALAAAIWPARWIPAEVEHHRLDSIWRELRSDADRSVAWERYAAWAEPADGDVLVGLIRSVPTGEKATDAPSPYRWEAQHRIDADEVTAAAEAMEALREDASEREMAGERRWREAQVEAERRAHEQQLAAIDHAAEVDAQVQEEVLSKEMAEREAADRRAQAEAVARALRRP